MLVTEPEQDEIIAGLLRRLWARPPQPEHPFSALKHMCSEWADEFELAYARDDRGLDPGRTRQGVEILPAVPANATTEALLCTDLHAGNVLAARREPWLMIDPKPLIGEPAFDPVQHMLNCESRLVAGPTGLAHGWRSCSTSTQNGSAYGYSPAAHRNQCTVQPCAN